MSADDPAAALADAFGAEGPVCSVCRRAKDAHSEAEAARCIRTKIGRTLGAGARTVGP